MKLQGGEKFKLENVIYVHQAVKNILIVSKIVSKGVTLVATKDKMTINKNGVIIHMNTRKGKTGAQ